MVSLSVDDIIALHTTALTLGNGGTAHAFFLAESQPFLDGNKRTAALALTVFLDMNGYELYEAEETELADRLVELGSGVIDQGEFFGWVCNHAKQKSAASL